MGTIRDANLLAGRRCIPGTLRCAASAADWPGWRGPTGMGVSDEKDLPLTWGGKDDENILWKQPLPGRDREEQAGQQPVQPDRAGRPRLRHRQLLAGRRGPEGVPRASRRLLQGGRRNAAVGREGRAGAVEAVRPARRLHGADAGRRRRARLRPVRLVRPRRARSRRQARLAQGNHTLSTSTWPSVAAPFSTGTWCCCSATRTTSNRGCWRSIAKPAIFEWEKKRPEIGFTHSTPVLAEIGGQDAIARRGVQRTCKASIRPTAR